MIVLTQFLFAAKSISDCLVDQKSNLVFGPLFEYCEFNMGGLRMELPFKKINSKLLEKFFSEFFNDLLKMDEYLSFEATECIRKKVTKSIYSCTIKVLIFEIHSNQNSYIIGNGTSSSKYNNFDSYFSTDKGINLLLARYPLLGDSLKNLSEDFDSFICEFCKRYINDRVLLERDFTIGGKVHGIEFVGDRHNGRQNIRIKFEKGELFYKSHSLTNDLCLQEIISELKVKWNIKLPKTISRVNYGWQEVISTGYSGSNYKKIYYQFGVLSAISYMFDITDLHKENIVISNNSVYVVDTESLLQVDFLNFNGDKKFSATEKINKELLDSVLSSDLYPVTMLESSGKFDTAGITGMGGTVLKNKAQKVFNAYSSDIYIKYGDYMTPKTYNRPLGIDPRDYSNYVAEGLEDTLKLIINNKELFIKKIQEKYLEIRTRIIFRNTSEYGQILRILNNPKYLSKYDNREFLFKKIIVNAKGDKIQNRIVNFEINEMKRGDIPYFFVDHGTGEVRDLKGNNIITWDSRTLLKKIENKIKSLDTETIKTQKKLISIALAKPIKNWDMGEHIDIINNMEPLDIVKCRKHLKQLAEKMANKMIENATYSDDGSKCSWLKVGITSNELWSIAPMDYSLYDGLPGVILSLAYMYKVSKNEKYKLSCEDSVSELEYILENLVEEPTEYSVFNGIGGLVYMYYHLSKIFVEDTHYIQGYKYWLKKMLMRLGEYSKLDFLDGIAGVLVLLSRLYLVEKDTELIQHIERLQKKLLSERTVTFRDKKVWESDIIRNNYLNGFSHGISGIIYSLAVSYQAVPNPRIYKCVSNAIDVENSSLVAGNWIDLRNRDNRLKKNFPDPIHWCHGAPGIGISRIGVYSSMGMEECERDINIALKTTIMEGFGGCDALCHGNFGNIELLLENSLLKKDIETYGLTLSVASELVKNKQDIEDFIYGIPQKNVISYGLMTGISGIVYQLLRLAEPDKVPSILNLEELRV